MMRPRDFLRDPCVPSEMRAAIVVLALLVTAALASTCTPTIACDRAASSDTCPVGLTCAANGVCVDGAVGEGEGEGEGSASEGEGAHSGEGEGAAAEGEGEGDGGALIPIGTAGCCGLDAFRIANVPRGDVDAVALGDEIIIAHAAEFQSDFDGVRVIDVLGDGTITRLSVDGGTEVRAPSLAIDGATARPHLAYRTADDVVRHGLRIGGQWFTDDAASALARFPIPKIAVDAAGLPVVVFTDLVFGGVNVVNFTGDQWSSRVITDTSTASRRAGAGPDLVVDESGFVNVSFSESSDGLAHFARELFDHTFAVETIDATLFASEGVNVAAVAAGDFVAAFGATDTPGAVLHAVLARRHAGSWTTVVVDDSAALASSPLVSSGAGGTWVAYLLDDGAGGNVARLAHAGSDNVFDAQTLSSDGPFDSIALALDAAGSPVVVMAPSRDELLLAR